MVKDDHICFNQTATCSKGIENWQRKKNNFWISFFLIKSFVVIIFNLIFYLFCQNTQKYSAMMYLEDSSQVMMGLETAIQPIQMLQSSQSWISLKTIETVMEGLDWNFVILRSHGECMETTAMNGIRPPTLILILQYLDMKWFPWLLK